MPDYRLNMGLDYPPDGVGDEVRAEAGDVRSDLPPESIPWLLASGVIVPVVTENGSVPGGAEFAPSFAAPPGTAVLDTTDGSARW